MIAAATAVYGLPATLAGLFDRSGRLPREIAGAWGRFLLRCLGVSIEVVGRENVPRGPAVYAANHASALDIPVMLGYLPADFRFLHKRSLYYVPVVGQYLYCGGHVAVERGRAFRARKSLAVAAQRIRAGTSVVVFPEGTRSADGSVLPFKRGSFLLAIEAGVPVVPVSLANVKVVIPRGITTLRPGTVRLVIHPPLPTVGRAPEEAEALAAEARARVERGVVQQVPA